MGRLVCGLRQVLAAGGEHALLQEESQAVCRGRDAGEQIECRVLVGGDPVGDGDQHVEEVFARLGEFGVAALVESRQEGDVEQGAFLGREPHVRGGEGGQLLGHVRAGGDRRLVAAVLLLVALQGQ